MFSIYLKWSFGIQTTLFSSTWIFAFKAGLWKLSFLLWFFFPFSFSLLKFKNSSDFFILSHMFHPSYKDLDTCLHRWRRQRNKTYWEWKVQWEVTPKNQLNLLLLFMMKQFGKRRNSENSRDWDEPEQRQSTNEGCKSDLVRVQHFYSQLC